MWRIVTSFLLSWLFLLSAEKLTYISVEHPLITYTNPRFIRAANITSLRFGRSNPVYYVNLYFDSLIYFGNNLTIDFYFYEFLTNRYQPSFVEMHFKFCNLIHNDLFFGAAMKQGRLDGPCPYPPGEYNLVNMTILPDAIPRGFPFTKGRIYTNLNISMPREPKQPVFAGHIDMELKTINVRNRKRKNKL